MKMNEKRNPEFLEEMHLEEDEWVTVSGKRQVSQKTEVGETQERPLLRVIQLELALQYPRNDVYRYPFLSFLDLGYSLHDAQRYHLHLVLPLPLLLLLPPPPLHR